MRKQDQVFLTTLITTLALLAPHNSRAYSPYLSISTEVPRHNTSSAALVRNTREHLSQQLHAGQNIYGNFEPNHHVTTPEHQLPPDEELFSQEFRDREAKKAQVMKSYRDRCDTVHAVFESQRPQLECQLTAWEHKHHQRVTAYRKTLQPQTDRTRYSQQHRHEMASHADTFLRMYDLDPRKYVYANGNAFQHEIMQEIVAGIHDSARVQLPSYDKNPFAHCIMYHTAHAFDDARETNALGDCVSSIKLIDIAHTLLDYCKKVSSSDALRYIKPKIMQAASRVKQRKALRLPGPITNSKPSLVPR